METRLLAIWVLVFNQTVPCRWTCLVVLMILSATLPPKGKFINIFAPACRRQFILLIKLHKYVLYRAQTGLSLPVPLGMFMNMAHVPPRFYNQHQQAMQAREQQQTPRGQNRRPPQRQKGNVLLCPESTIFCSFVDLFQVKTSARTKRNRSAKAFSSRKAACLNPDYLNQVSACLNRA